MGWIGTEDIRSHDGTRLAYFVAKDPDVPKGDVVLCHGFAEHMGRYAHVADAMVTAGYRVRGLDLRGHGKSDGKRGHVRRWSDYCDDLLVAVARAPSEPFVVAHSMGGLVALDLIRDHAIRGLVASSPLLRPIVKAPRWKTASAVLLSRIIPSLSLGNELNPEHVTRDVAIRTAYASDPLVFHSVTPRWYTEMLAASERIVAYAPKYKLPALLQVGRGEKVVDPAPIEKLAADWGGPCEFRGWDGLYHELFNEPERDEVIAHVVGWLDRQG